MRLIYTKHKDWQGTLNLRELKSAFKVRNLKYELDKIDDDEYEFEFSDEDIERVKQAYNVLVNICDLEIRRF